MPTMKSTYVLRRRGRAGKAFHILRTAQREAERTDLEEELPEIIHDIQNSITNQMFSGARRVV